MPRFCSLKHLKSGWDRHRLTEKNGFRGIRLILCPMISCKWCGFNQAPVSVALLQWPTTIRCFVLMKVTKLAWVDGCYKVERQK